MTVKVFTLTSFVFRVLSSRNLIKRCRNCGYVFKLGDVIISKQGSGGSARTYWYCRKCAVKFQLI
jgi:hypothetical protein